MTNANGMNRAMILIKKYWPTMIVLGVILYATLDSDPVDIDQRFWFPHLDKLIHAIMMGGLTAAIAFDMQRSDRRPGVLSTAVMMKICCCVIAFGALDELAQGWMDNGRGCELLDFAADAVGAVCAMLLAPPAIRKVLGVKRQEVGEKQERDA